MRSRSYDGRLRPQLKLFPGNFLVSLQMSVEPIDDPVPIVQDMAIPCGHVPTHKSERKTSHPEAERPARKRARDIV
jgi:hypothetical protein